MAALALLLFVVSPIWPEYKLWKSGAVVLALVVCAVLSILYVSWVEKIKEQGDRSKEKE